MIFVDYIINWLQVLAKIMLSQWTVLGHFPTFWPVMRIWQLARHFLLYGSIDSCTKMYIDLIILY